MQNLHGQYYKEEVPEHFQGTYHDSKEKESQGKALYRNRAEIQFTTTKIILWDVDSTIIEDPI